jgi:hypothetical protein
VGDAEDGSRWVFGGIAAVAGKREALAYSAREEQ